MLLLPSYTISLKLLAITALQQYHYTGHMGRYTQFRHIYRLKNCLGVQMLIALKKVFTFTAITVLVCSVYVYIPPAFALDANSDSILQEAFQQQRSKIQINGNGIVTRLLPDDTEGSRHQRFIVKTQTGQTLLIAHNIDLAARISDLQEGTTIEFYGEYEWNNKGGVIHWTHHDPNNNHAHGWLKYKGKIYQ